MSRLALNTSTQDKTQNELVANLQGCRALFLNYMTTETENENDVTDYLESKSEKLQRLRLNMYSSWIKILPSQNISKFWEKHYNSSDLQVHTLLRDDLINESEEGITADIYNLNYFWILEIQRTQLKESTSWLKSDAVKAEPQTNRRRKRLIPDDLVTYKRKRSPTTENSAPRTQHVSEEKPPTVGKMLEKEFSSEYSQYDALRKDQQTLLKVYEESCELCHQYVEVGKVYIRGGNNVVTSNDDETPTKLAAKRKKLLDNKLLYHLKLFTMVKTWSAQEKLDSFRELLQSESNSETILNIATDYGQTATGLNTELGSLRQESENEDEDISFKHNFATSNRQIVEHISKLYQARLEVLRAAITRLKQVCFAPEGTSAHTIEDVKCLVKLVRQYQDQLCVYNSTMKDDLRSCLPNYEADKPSNLITYHKKRNAINELETQLSGNKQALEAVAAVISDSKSFLDSTFNDISRYVDTSIIAQHPKIGEEYVAIRDNINKAIAICKTTPSINRHITPLENDLNQVQERFLQKVNNNNNNNNNNNYYYYYEIFEGLKKISSSLDSVYCLDAVNTQFNNARTSLDTRAKVLLDARDAIEAKVQNMLNMSLTQALDDTDVVPEQALLPAIYEVSNKEKLQPFNAAEVNGVVAYKEITELNKLIAQLKDKETRVHELHNAAVCKYKDVLANKRELLSKIRECVREIETDITQTVRIVRLHELDDNLNSLKDEMPKDKSLSEKVNQLNAEKLKQLQININALDKPHVEKANNAFLDSQAKYEKANVELRELNDEINLKKEALNQLNPLLNEQLLAQRKALEARRTELEKQVGWLLAEIKQIRALKGSYNFTVSACHSLKQNIDNELNNLANSALFDQPSRYPGESLLKNSQHVTATLLEQLESVGNEISNDVDCGVLENMQNSLEAKLKQLETPLPDCLPVNPTEKQDGKEYFSFENQQEYEAALDKSQQFLAEQAQNPKLPILSKFKNTMKELSNKIEAVSFATEQGKILLEEAQKKIKEERYTTIISRWWQGVKSRASSLLLFWRREREPDPVVVAEQPVQEENATKALVFVNHDARAFNAKRKNYEVRITTAEYVATIGVGVGKDEDLHIPQISMQAPLNLGIMERASTQYNTTELTLIRNQMSFRAAGVTGNPEYSHVGLSGSQATFFSDARSRNTNVVIEPSAPVAEIVESKPEITSAL